MGNFVGFWDLVARMSLFVFFEFTEEFFHFLQNFSDNFGLLGIFQAVPFLAVLDLEFVKVFG